MTGKTNVFEQGLLQAVFQAVFSSSGVTTLFANASSPATNIWMSLHSSDPGIGGSQNSAESVYTGYARVSVARTSGGFSVSSNSVSPAANISFPACTGGSTTAVNWGIGLSSAGAGTLLYTGTITPNIVISNGVTPILTTGSAVTES